MAIQISDLKVMLSGGVANGDPVLSLGGDMSGLNAAEVISQVTTQPSLVEGVNIINAYANEIGAGVIKWDSVEGMLLWQPHGGLQFDGMKITENGVYAIGSSNGYIICDVRFDLLPGSTVSDADIQVNNATNKVFDSVSATESTDGRIEYRCLFLRNTNIDALSAYDVRIWMKQQPVGPDELDLAIDPVGLGTGQGADAALGPLVDEEDSTGILDGQVVWTRPSTQATALQLGTIPAGKAVGFWQKRTVFAETNVQVANDYSKIGISALI